MLPGARSTLRLSDPYHLQVSVTRSHAAQLMPKPTAHMNATTVRCRSRVRSRAADPRAWHLHRGARAHALHSCSRCAHVARDARRGHQQFCHFIPEAARARMADACASRGAQDLLSAYTVRRRAGGPQGGGGGHQDDALLRCHAGSVPDMSLVGCLRDLASSARVFMACNTFGSALAKLLAHTV